MFRLKPARGNRALLIYHLRCPSCRSADIAHNIPLFNGINNKLPIQELRRLSEEETEITIHLYANCKYFPTIAKAHQAKGKEKPEYFLLQSATGS